MPTLRIGTRTFETDEGSLNRAAERMFRLSPPQRRYRVEKAKTRLARACAEERAAPGNPIVVEAVATILSQGITEI
jgi:hypothetical protein